MSYGLTLGEHLLGNYFWKFKFLHFSFFPPKMTLGSVDGRQRRNPINSEMYPNLRFVSSGILSPWKQNSHTRTSAAPIQAKRTQPTFLITSVLFRPKMTFGSVDGRQRRNPINSEMCPKLTFVSSGILSPWKQNSHTRTSADPIQAKRTQPTFLTTSVLFFNKWKTFKIVEYNFTEQTSQLTLTKLSIATYRARFRLNFLHRTTPHMENCYKESILLLTVLWNVKHFFSPKTTKQSGYEFNVCHPEVFKKHTHTRTHARTHTHIYIYIYI